MLEALIIQELGAGRIYPQDGWSKRAADVSVDSVPNVKSEVRSVI